MKSLKTIKLERTFILSLIIFSFCILNQNLTFAQEEMEGSKEEPRFSISGSADVYFRTNLNTSNDGTEGETVAPATSFANLPGFSLGMANIIGTYEADKSGVVVDLVFGPRGSDAVFASPLNSNSANIINQLYAYWNASDAVTFTIGNFNTFLGYEVISPTGNFNYSTSYMFSYGPFSHTGLKADFDFGNDFTGMLGILNPTDITEFNPTSDYFVGAQLGYKGFYLNALVGDEYTQIDITGGFDVSETYYLGINTTVTDAGGESDYGFWGVAMYNQITLSDVVALGVRFEYFNDTGGDYVFGLDIEDTSAIDITLSANINLGGLMLIPEIRLDSFSEDLVIDGPNSTGKSLSSFVVAAVYEF